MQIAVECSRDLDWDICMYKRLCLGPSDWHRKTASLNSGNNSILGYLQLIEECLVPGNSIILSCYCTAGVRFPFHAFFDTVRSHSDVVLISIFNATRKEDCCCFSIWKHVLSPGWACVHVQSNFSTRRVLTVARRGNRLMFSHRKQPTHQIFPSLFLLFPLLASEVFLFLSFIRCSWNVIQYFCEDLVMKTKNGLFGSLFAKSVTCSLSRSFSLSSHFSSNSSFARINSQTTCLSFWEQIL